MIRMHTALFTTVALFAVGCSANVEPPADEPAQIEGALEAEAGGLSTQDEAPGFDDPTVKAVGGFAQTFADPSDLTATESAQAGARSYTVAVLWGHLPPAHDADPTDVEPAPVDWTGSVSVDAGAIGVKKTLRFEGADAVLPRTDARAVAFRSHTLPSVDGLLLRVVVPTGKPGVLHFDTGALKANVDLAALAQKGESAERMADGRSGVAFVGFADVPGCARGFLMGRWNKVRPQLGTFRGRVADADGAPLGHVRGIWGHAPRKDKNVFFGKTIAEDGAHRGLFGGTYGGGSFQGLWGVRDPARFGALEGVYGDGYAKDDGRGLFVGRWSERCAAP